MSIPHCNTLQEFGMDTVIAKFKGMSTLFLDLQNENEQSWH